MITPDRFLDQAKRLLAAGAGTSEEDSRSAISRAYYSLFHETKQALESRHRANVIAQISQYLRTNNQAFNPLRLSSLDEGYLRVLKVNMHIILTDVLRRLDSPMGNDFKGFRRQRNIADYDLRQNLDPIDSETKVNAMDRLIQSVRTI